MTPDPPSNSLPPPTALPPLACSPSQNYHEIKRPKDQKEFDALATTEDRAKWLLRKGVTAKPTMFPKLNKLCYGAYSAGVLIPGEYESKEAAISGRTAWLTEKAGLANLKVCRPLERTGENAE